MADRNIPIKFNRDFSVIDSEFSNIREKFDSGQLFNNKQK